MLNLNHLKAFLATNPYVYRSHVDYIRTLDGTKPLEEWLNECTVPSVLLDLYFMLGVEDVQKEKSLNDDLKVRCDLTIKAEDGIEQLKILDALIDRPLNFHFTARMKLLEGSAIFESTRHPDPVSALIEELDKIHEYLASKLRPLISMEVIEDRFKNLGTVFVQ